MSTKQFNYGWLIFQIPGSPVFEDSPTHALKAGYATDVKNPNVPKSYRKLAEEPCSTHLNQEALPKLGLHEFVCFLF